MPIYMSKEELEKLGSFNVSSCPMKSWSFRVVRTVTTTSTVILNVQVPEHMDEEQAEDLVNSMLDSGHIQISDEVCLAADRDQDQDQASYNVRRIVQTGDSNPTDVDTLIESVWADPEDESYS